ncbi:MAG TPA: hypothetical protein VJH65_00945 [Candidatus Nanoarchaeia archaeon]|nr:hypothetical protein [Candidatus Nanoarchaeia archaeon]
MADHPVNIEKANIAELRVKLNSINKEKEVWFKKKEDLKLDINKLVSQIKEFKSKRDKANISVSELKKQRDTYNSQVKSLISQLKTLNKEKYSVLKKYNIKVDPAKIIEKINSLERQVETEVNFKKEQKLMEEIKKLKRAYDQVAEVNEVVKKTTKIENEFKEAKRKADDIHNKIRLLTKDDDYINFIDMSKKINDLKKEQEEAFNKFISYKNEYLKVQNQIDDLMPKKPVYIEKKQDRSIKDIFKEKYRAIEEKLRQKKKLTTEDIITLQGKMD